MRPTRLISTAALREVEGLAAPQSHPPLMILAGRAVARRALALARGRRGPIVLAAGPGNNGGDAWVAAEQLLSLGAPVVVWAPLGNGTHDAVAAGGRARFRAEGGVVVQTLPRGPALVVDGLFGIGLSRNLSGRALDSVSAINACGAPVLAIDVPSGLDADTGATRGAAVRATHTITFIAGKPGLVTGNGPGHAGQVEVDSLGIDDVFFPENAGVLLTHDTAPRLQPRAANSHKGSFGTVGIVGGAAGMAGAPILAARGALFAGAGKVYATLLAPGAPCFDPAYPEILLRALGETLTADVLVAGPGAGAPDSAFAREVLPRLLAADQPLVLDADALTALAHQRALPHADLRRRRAPTLLTPHPGEAARLLGASVADIQGDRVAAATELAHRFGADVVLKGAGSVCAGPDGDWAINASGNAGLASGGTGDVLAGVIGALLAQGMAPAQALRLAVWAHGAAADGLVIQGVGPAGLTAGELPAAIRAILNAP